MSLREEEVRRLGRPTDTDSAATRQRVLEAARILFARDGLAATTNKALADAANLTPTAIYHYFTSKSDLYLAVCRDVIEQVTDIFASAAASSTSLTDRIDVLVDRIGRVNANDPSFAAFIMSMSDEARRNADVRDAVTSLQRRLSTMLVRLIDTSSDKEVLLCGSSSVALADMLLSTIGGFARLRVNTRSATRPREAAELLLRMMRRASHAQEESTK